MCWCTWSRGTRSGKTKISRQDAKERQERKENSMYVLWALCGSLRLGERLVFPKNCYNPHLLPVLRRVFKAFHYRDFRLMWIGACTSSIGTWMQIIAQGWLIWRLSHSAFLLALDQFLGGIPIFLFSLIGGVVADRTERRKILLLSQYVQMACATVLT